MKTYRQKLTKSYSFYWVIGPIIFCYIAIAATMILFPQVKLMQVIQSILVITGITIMGFAQLWYLVIDEEEFRLCNGIFKASKHTYKYSDIKRVSIIDSKILFNRLKVETHNNPARTEVMTLVHKKDLKHIAEDLRAKGIEVDTSKLSKKLK